MVEIRVTVVVIFLDADDFLAEALESIEVQSYPSWELLLVDDGSSDESPSIAQAAAARDPERVRYLQHPGGVNRGMSASRNLGIEEARGEFIAFLDADDVWLPERLQRHLALLERHQDCALVCGPTRVWYSWATESDEDRPVLREDSERALGLPEARFDPPDYMVAVLDEKAKTPAICSFTARTAVVREVGGFDEDFRGMFEDQVFFSKILTRYPVWITTDCLDLYRQHPASACYVARFQGHYHGSPANPDQRSFIARLDEIVRSLPSPSAELEHAVERWHRRYRHPIRARILDAVREPRRSLRIGLRTVAQAVLPDRLYRRIWARAQGFDDRHGDAAP